MRETVNSFKHHFGFKVGKNTNPFGIRVELTREDTYQTLEAAKVFLLQFLKDVQNI